MRQPIRARRIAAGIIAAVTIAPTHPMHVLKRADPLEVAQRWPTDAPLMMLRSAPADSPWSRWSILAAPQSTLTITNGDHVWRGAPPAPMPSLAPASSPLEVLDGALRATPSGAGMWIGFCSYDLGRTIEPSACAPGGTKSGDSRWPAIELAWCPAAFVHDNSTGEWQSVGNAAHLRDITASIEAGEPAAAGSPRVGSLRSCFTASAYRAAVQRVIDAIAAGDIFQANLTQRFSAAFTGSSRMLAMDALRCSGAWFGAYLELPDGRTICSLSPELFLDLDGRTRCVTTRPVKGTRPAHLSTDELLRSEKDKAELTMIIDLMRNDLGRVAEFGSVRVTQPREIESHAGVHHGVGEVVARLRDDCSITDLLRATMPAGSSSQVSNCPVLLPAKGTPVTPVRLLKPTL